MIVSSAHNFVPSHECPLPPPPPLTKCKFSTKIGSVTTTYDIERVVNSGYKCAPGAKRPGYGNDWVIFKLKKPVSPSIKPYKIADPAEVADQTELIHVAKSPDFNPINARSLDKAVRHYGRCKRQFSDAGRNTMENDCDASPGSSGGGVFTPGDDPKLVAITAGGSTQPCPDGNGSNKVGKYRHGCWATLATTITGGLRDALRAVEGSSGAEEAVPPLAAVKRPLDSEPLFNDL